MTAWQALHGRLLTLLPTLPGWTDCKVYDGEPVGQDNPQQYLTLAHVRDETGGGGLNLTQSGDGFADIESGTIRSELVAWTGDEEDPAGPRDTVFALFDALRAHVRDNRLLGVLTNGSVTLAADVLPVQNEDGVAYALVVTVSYATRLA